VAQRLVVEDEAHDLSTGSITSCSASVRCETLEDEAAMALRFVALDGQLVQEIGPWFDDPDTQRYLGGRDWIARELGLIREMPGARQRDKTIVGRWGWVAFDGAEPVGFVGAERYDDGTASATFVVAPDRRGQGIGRQVLSAMIDRSELAGVTRFVGGVEPDNVGCIQCLAALGATLPSLVDDDGMLIFEITR
jgi:RimJ/RimL family protein N-acetyltransferase